MAGTRNIIEAEKAYHQAQRDAADAGIEASAVESFIFADQADDGYLIEDVQGYMMSQDRTKVESWLQDIDPKGTVHRRASKPDDALDLPQRTRDGLVRFSESVLGHATGRDRERIDAWERIRSWEAAQL
jgi:hypothetical protein